MGCKVKGLRFWPHKCRTPGDERLPCGRRHQRRIRIRLQIVPQKNGMRDYDEGCRAAWR